MGIKSNRKIESYYNYFSTSGLDAVGSPPVMEVGWYGDRGVWGGGHQGGVGDKNTLDYINITSTGNATSFGALTVARGYTGAVSNGSRGVWGGSYNGDVMDYITFSTTSNATDFGDMTTATRSPAPAGNKTRGLFAGSNGDNNLIQYITIASTGNATDFGDLTDNRFKGGAGCSDQNGRGCFGGGHDAGVNDQMKIDYIQISTPGNGTDFGDLTVAREFLGACNNATRGVWGGGSTGDGSSNENVIDYVTISTTSNASDFGDLTGPRFFVSAASGD